MATQTHSFKITQVTQETEDTQSYVLVPLDPEKFTYRAGQFLTFLFEINGRKIRRPYSIATAPEIDKDIRILVKRIPNGEISRYIHDNWQVGHTVTSIDPSGKFVLDNITSTQRDLFLLAAGSGISPIMGILKEALHKYPNTHIKLYYSNKNAEQTIFYNEINQLVKTFPERLKVEYLFSESKFLLRARLNKLLLEELVSTHMRFSKEDALAYTCGPYDYMQFCEIVLRYMGFQNTHIKKEIFVVPEDEGDDDDSTQKAFDIKDKSPREVEVHIHKQVYTFTVNFPDSILDAALKNNIELPYSCRAGQCSTCSTKCISGEVVMSFNAVLTEREEKNGQILTCKGHPVSKKIILDYDNN